MTGPLQKPSDRDKATRGPCHRRLVRLLRARLVSSDGRGDGEQYWDDRWFALRDGCDTIQNLANDLSAVFEENDQLRQDFRAAQSRLLERDRIIAQMTAREKIREQLKANTEVSQEGQRPEL